MPASEVFKAQGEHAEFLGDAFATYARAMQCILKMAEFEGCTAEQLMARIENDLLD